MNRFRLDELTLEISPIADRHVMGFKSIKVSLITELNDNAASEAESLYLSGSASLVKFLERTTFQSCAAYLHMQGYTLEHIKIASIVGCTSPSHLGITSKIIGPGGCLFPRLTA